MFFKLLILLLLIHNCDCRWIAKAEESKFRQVDVTTFVVPKKFSYVYANPIVSPFPISNPDTTSFISPSELRALKSTRQTRQSEETKRHPLCFFSLAVPCFQFRPQE
ncbi:hypothetical protein M3Y98_00886700 [Aphelenchoides besseyi]|nr:hypothetical protein M3Y98_00886700 [Aphelenchoides besseyi]